MKTRTLLLVLPILTATSLAFAQQKVESNGVIIEQVPEQPPAPAPAPADQPAPSPPPKKEKNIPVGIRVDGGYSFRTLQKLDVRGADIGLGIGAQPARHFAIYGAVRGFFGSTPFGLDVRSLNIGCDFDIVIDRFRIGFDPGIFIVGVDRATRDQTITAWGPKLGAALRFDVVRADVFALFLRAAANGGPTFQDGSLYGGVTFGAGIDFDLKPGDRESL